MNKGERTKNRILDAAMGLFCKKGYVAVTMTAIKEATDLSVGGVYKYFKSTKDIFLSILARDEITMKTDVSPIANMTGDEILQYSFERNFEMASKQLLGWVVAMYEFMLFESEYMSVMKERFNSGIDFCKMMVAQERPDLCDEDLWQLALFVTNYLNGLQTTAMLHAFTKEEMRKQIKIFRHILFCADINFE